MNIDETRSSVNFTPAAQVPAVYGMARTITSITLHHWGEPGQDFDTVTNFLCNNTKPTSAHFVAEAGRVACIVSPPDAAWHAGNAEGNATSIGIECRPEATDGDYATVAELVAYLRSQYGPLPLHPHSFWFNTACPGVWDLARVDQLASGAAAVTAQGTITQEELVPNAQDQVFIAIDGKPASLEGILNSLDSKISEALAAVRTVATFKAIDGHTVPLAEQLRSIDNKVTNLPAAVLNQTFKLTDGTVTNLAGILSAINAKPVPTGGTVQAADPQAVVNAIVNSVGIQITKK